MAGMFKFYPSRVWSLTYARHSFQVFDTIDPNKSYRSHVKMIEGSEKIWTGDVAIFSGERLVAKFVGIAVSALT